MIWFYSLIIWKSSRMCAYREYGHILASYKGPGYEASSYTITQYPGFISGFRSRGFRGGGGKSKGGHSHIKYRERQFPRGGGRKHPLAPWNKPWYLLLFYIISPTWRIVLIFFTPSFPSTFTGDWQIPQEDQERWHLASLRLEKWHPQHVQGVPRPDSGRSRHSVLWV
jgi:hypothetical protein